MAQTTDDSIRELLGFQVMDNPGFVMVNTVAFSLDRGLMLQGLTIWMDKYMNGMEVTWTDGTTQRIGESTGKVKSIYFNAGEKCKQASFFGGAIDGIEGIRIVTNAQTFEFGYLNDKETPLSVGSGLLAGVVRGGFGFGFIFLAPLKKVVSRIAYEDLPPGSTGIDSMDVEKWSHPNDSNVPYDASWTKTYTQSVTYSWSQSATAVFGMSASISAGIPEIAEAESELHWEISNETSHEASETIQKDLSWSYSITVPPHTTIYCTATTNYGRLNIDYTATVTLTFLNDKVATYTEEGTYDGVSYTGIVVHTTEEME